MTTSEQVFLVLCQELSFRRAAEKCYMSQQGLSEHIKRLETQYGVPLFQRRPKVALTQAGQSLRRTLESEAVLEQDLSREMENLRDGTRGKVTIGIGISRARIYLPRILELFWKEAPGVEVIVRMDNSAQLEEELAAGKLDCTLPDLSVIPVRQGSDEIRQMSASCRLLDLLLCRSQTSVGDVFTQRTGEQEHILLHNPDLGPE